jgi:pimeloyl-ACP methyl ester carboxylesterase
MTIPAKSDILHYELYRVDNYTPWMVFVHGAGGSVRTWQKQVAFFKGKFNLLLVDLRDHGNSQNITESFTGFGFDTVAEDVLRTMDALDIHEAHFVGVSMGSIIIRNIEQITPERVSSVVLAGGIFKMSRKINVLVISAKLLTHILPFHTLYRMFALILLPRNNHAASRRVFIREAQKLRKKEVKKWLRLIQRLNRTLQEMFNHRIKAPCLVVMGEQDHVFLEPARQYVAKYGEVVLETIEKCGHVCNIESPAEFNERCLRFIERLEQNNLEPA